MKCFYILSDNTDPYKNLAMEQALFRYVDKETMILFLWQNDNTIVIGKNQDAYAECRVNEFLASGGRIARRRSGGGAVYHDSGNLNFSILCLEKLARKNEYQSVMAKALKTFGLTIEFNGRNDLLIQGRKFSGNAFYSDGKVLCQHGTILIDTDVEKMAYYLTPDTEKLERNYVRSVKARVINLKELSADISITAMQQIIIDTLHARQLSSILGDEEIKKLGRFDGKEFFAL